MVEVEVKVSSSESRVHLCVLCRCSFASPWVSALASQRVSSCIALGVSSCLLLQSGLPLASQGKTGSSRAHAVFVSFSFFLSPKAQPRCSSKERVPYMTVQFDAMMWNRWALALTGTYYDPLWEHIEIVRCNNHSSDQKPFWRSYCGLEMHCSNMSNFAALVQDEKLDLQSCCFQQLNLQCFKVSLWLTCGPNRILSQTHLFPPAVKRTCDEPLHLVSCASHYVQLAPEPTFWAPGVLLWFPELILPVRHGDAEYRRVPT